jgi:predicted regulator of Ras-like GTPase activity (Roadblock/LC7/MglB family)
MVKNRNIKETTTTVMVDGSPVTIALDEDHDFTGLRSSLIEINKVEGVKGYILKNTTSAVIDLQDPAKLMDYALLSSRATDACQEISDLFKLEVTKTVIEGADLKVLSMIIGKNRLSVFMEKNVDHIDIFRRISP